jgi:cytochrome c-type biogenesis protein CcmH/NrfG
MKSQRSNVTLLSAALMLCSMFLVLIFASIKSYGQSNTSNKANLEESVNPKSQSTDSELALLKALARTEKQFGADAPENTTSLAALAELYLHNNRLDEYSQMKARLLEIYEKNNPVSKCSTIAPRGADP